MDKKTLTALKGSIAKWRAIVDGTGEDNGPHNCPLCRLFHPRINTDQKEPCEGCPVMQRTGNAYCRGTPYEELDAIDEDDGAYKELARDELDFLISLLPAPLCPRPVNNAPEGKSAKDCIADGECGCDHSPDSGGRS